MLKMESGTTTEATASEKATPSQGVGRGRISSARAIERLTKPGRYPVGDRLYVQVSASGAKSFVMRYQLNGARHDLGLGRFPDRTLVMAEAEAAAIRRQIAEGIDPLATRRAARATADAETRREQATFDQVSAEYIEAHRAGWKSAKSAAQWRASLSTYASPTIGTKPVAEIATDDVLAILRPIWSAKNVTATRVRQRIEAILDYARVQGFRPGESANPARLHGHLALMLPKSSAVHAVQNHAALPINRVPEVMAALAATPGIAALVVRWIALTACRAGEAVGASWAEIDRTSKVWLIPASRTKTRRPHRVPLPAEALEVLDEARRGAGGNGSLLFPSPVPGEGGVAGPLSLTSLMKALRSASSDRSTVHGLRSVFRDWASEIDGAPDDLAEVALAHVRGSKTKRAYARGDMLDRRRPLMARWAQLRVRREWTCSAPAVMKKLGAASRRSSRPIWAA